MKEHSIKILGPIGEFKLEDGNQVNGVTLLDIVTEIAKGEKDFNVLHVAIATVGGATDAGDQIYDYLMAFKKDKGVKIVMHQIGLIASIGTKIVLAGDEIIALDDGTKNWMIHNPWTVTSGNSSTHAKVLESLIEEETKMKTFYNEKLGIDINALNGLMIEDTWFDAKTAVALKFATSYVQAPKIAAYMTKEKSTFMVAAEKLLASIRNIGKPTALSMIVDLKDGRKLSVESETAEDMQGKKVVSIDEQGQAGTAPTDGEYETADGMALVISGGLINEIKKPAPVVPPAPPAAPPAPPASPDNGTEELKNQITMLLNINKESVEKMDGLHSEIVKLRGMIKSDHVLPAGAVAGKKEDVEEWKKLSKENKINALKVNDPKKFQRLFFAMYGKMPNM